MLAELDRLSARGGVLGAMETGYQRGRIQDESLLYEQRKHDGSLPIVGVNTFLPPERAGSGDGASAAADGGGPGDGGGSGGDGRAAAPDGARGGAASTPALARSTEEEKQRQIARLRGFQARHAAEAPAALDRLRSAALAGENVFDVLMDVVRVCSLGQITQALYEVGGRYRRSM